MHIVSRTRPTMILLGILSLVFGILIDTFVFPDIAPFLPYIPLMIMIGFLSRYLLTSLLFPLLFVSISFVVSTSIWSIESFLLKWFTFTLTALVVRMLVNNIEKEKQNLLDFTSSLTESLDARDKYTSYHSHNVAYYSREIAQAMKLSRKECENLYVGGLLHDIGKIGVPENVLNKPSRLTNEEFELIKQHPQMGYNILKHVPVFKNNSILEIVLHHHEKYNGTGYPQGLTGIDIPLAARIMAIADSFDAMTSKRIYRDKPNLDYAKTELINGKTTQFDPEIVDVFLNLLEKRKIIVKS